MDRPVAQVLAVYDGRLLVSISAASACPRCAAGKGCGAGLISAASRDRQIEVTPERGLQVVAGDFVALSMPASELLRAAVCAYGLPLAGMVSLPGAARIALGSLADGVAIVAALAGLILGWICGRQLLRRSQCLQRFQAERTAGSE